MTAIEQPTDQMTRSGRAPQRRHPHHGLTLSVLVLSATSYALAQTLVAPALPDIQRQLHCSAASVAFLLTAFLLSASVATPILGRLGDMFGKKWMLVATLVVFAAGSLVAALANSIGVMITGRAVQGVGGAIFPLAYGIIRDEFPREKVSAGIGIISATFGVGGGAGLVLSGVVVENWGYHWLYWITLVAVVAAAIATVLFVPESPVKVPARVDWVGALLLSGALVGILVGLSQGQPWGWSSGRTIGCFAAGAGLLGLLVVVELRQPGPLIDMRLLSRRAVAMPNATGFLVGFGMFDAFILIPTLVQADPRTGYGFGVGVTGAGLFLLPLTMVMLLSGPMAGWMGGRVGSRLPMIVGTAVTCASFVFIAADHHDRWAVYTSTGLLGLGIGFSYAAMANLVIDAVDQSQVGAATGVNTIMRTVGGTLGAQIAASILVSHVQRSGAPAESGFTDSFVMSAVALALAAAAALAIPGASAARRPGDGRPRHRRR